MWISILLKIIISFIIIFIAHHLFIYLKDNYSVKKTKDLVGSQIIKYKTILQNIQEREISNALVIPPSYPNPSYPSSMDPSSIQIDDLYPRTFEMVRPSGSSLQIVGDIRPSMNSNVPVEFIEGLKDDLQNFLNENILSDIQM